MAPWFAIAAAAALALGCDASPPCDPALDSACAEPPDDDGGDLFAEALIEIDIEIEAARWEALRTQRKSRHSVFGFEDCRNQVIANPYTWFAADVTIDGETIATAGLRKKGHLGSQSTRKPSLKIKLDEFVEGQAHGGVTRFALNNSKSDPSYARTCLAYALFAAAGVPAPRCTFARVAVNGEDLGIYVAVEEIKRPFLERHFASADGNLYEGTACDFRPEFLGGFEQETNTRSDPSQADLEAVYRALRDAADGELEAALATHVNLDRFYRFWAAESLIWHRDGYSGHANNYFVYADPADGGRFAFIPWGPDSAFRPDNRDQVPDSVLAFGAIANRLYATAGGRARYDQTLADLLDSAWDPAALGAELESVEATIGDYVLEPEPGGFERAVAEVADFIDSRRSIIEAATAGGPPAWTAGMRTLPCRIPVGPVAASFSTRWDSLGDPALATGEASLTLELDGQPVEIIAAGSRAGTTDAGGDRIHLVLDAADERRFQIVADLPDPRFFDPFVVPGEHDLVSPPLRIAVTELDMSRRPAAVLRRFDIGEGTWRFEAASQEPGAPVAGSFSGTLYRGL